MSVTEKQLGFINRLFQEISENSEKLSDADSEKATALMEPVVPHIVSLKKGNDVGKREASNVIETLIDVKSFVESSLNIVHCRWKKMDDKWFVLGPANVVVPGATVMVKSSKGEKEVTIASATPFDDGKALGVPEREEVNIPTNVEEGIWKNASGDLIEIYKTRKGFLVGKLIDQETGERTYLGKAGLNDLVHKLTLEEAQEWGRKTGICCVCSRQLTNPDSISAGIGPICAGRWG